VRRFRVDRVLEVRRTGREASVPPGVEATADGALRGGSPVAGGDGSDGVMRPFVPGGDADIVRIRVDEDAMWLVDAVPVVAVTPRAGGGADVSVAVASRVWLERLLLQIGPHGRVLGPAAYTTVGPDAARAVLTVYGASTTSADSDETKDTDMT
jgi:hypothetical protein